MTSPDPWAAHSIPTLKGRRLTLRKLRPSDLGDRQKLGRSSEENRMYGGTLSSDTSMTFDEATAWYQNQHDRDDAVRWAIEYEGRCIGSCGLTGSGELRRYAIGISDPSLWGRGLGTEASRLVVDYAFSNAEVQRIELMVLEYNQRAIRSYQKAGFQLREILKGSCEIGNERFDDWMMELGRSAWLDKQLPHDASQVGPD
ncbi:MAG: GNAT family N-acetyltransferase [Candidatus Dormibacteria bacterium]